jgi:hypothetical protein
LKAQVERLEKVRCANEVLRRVSRFLVLARRLEGQMGFVTNKNEGGKTGGGDGKEDGSGEGEREREMAKAALTIAELGKHISSIPSGSIVLIRYFGSCS